MATGTLEAELAAALRERIAVIGDRALRDSDPAAHLAKIQEASERITDLEKRLPENIHPQLRHYFERRSYDKALAWLESQGIDGSAR